MKKTNLVDSLTGFIKYNNGFIVFGSDRVFIVA